MVKCQDIRISIQAFACIFYVFVTTVCNIFYTT